VKRHHHGATDTDSLCSLGLSTDSPLVTSIRQCVVVVVVVAVVVVVVVVAGWLLL